jgi:hypothetical protein
LTCLVHQREAVEGAHHPPITGVHHTLGSIALTCKYSVLDGRESLIRQIVIILFLKTNIQAEAGCWQPLFPPLVVAKLQPCKILSGNLLLL